MYLSVVRLLEMMDMRMRIPRVKDTFDRGHM
jgi:hypothetical protein